MKSLPLILIIAAAGVSLGQGTLMVDTNTGTIRYPTNFLVANSIASTDWVSNREAAVRSEISNVSAAAQSGISNVSTRLSTAEGSISVWQRDSIALGSNAVCLVSTNYIVVVGASTPSGVAGTYWSVPSTNYTIFASTNGWFIWGNTYDFIISASVGNTNGAAWLGYWDYFYDVYPYHSATGDLSYSVQVARPAAQIGAGTNDSPGVFSWLGQPIADGTMGIYIGGRWITNSTALSLLTATNNMPLWRGHPLADSNGMTFVGGSLWTNRLVITNLSFVSSVATNSFGELVAVTSTATVISTP